MLAYGTALDFAAKFWDYRSEWTEKSAILAFFAWLIQMRLFLYLIERETKPSPQDVVADSNEKPEQIPRTYAVAEDNPPENLRVIESWLLQVQKFAESFF
jgi:hypothetical protein